MRRLGDILVARGIVSREDVERYVSAAAPLGKILRAHTIIRSRALAEALAEQHGLPMVALPSDHSMFQSTLLGHYLEHQYLPYQRIPFSSPRLRGESEGGTRATNSMRSKSVVLPPPAPPAGGGREGRLIVATPEPSSALKAMLERYYGCPIDLAVIPARDFSSALARMGATTLTRRARLALRRRSRHLVADRVLVTPQLAGLGAMFAALAAAFWFAPGTSWHVLLAGCNLFYFITLLFKLQLYARGRAESKVIQREAAELRRVAARLKEDHLPVYSILAPLYGEDFAVVTRLIGHLHALDYPKEKLDIKLICEADDARTVAAIKAAKPPETMEIVLVAPSTPRTKPKACNVALQQIRGEYLVIFDAEDAPDAMQLKLAVAGFKQHPREVACLQSLLNYYNRDENLLTKLFSIEYSALFRLLLPAMQRMELPIPLGGTSNHLRVEALKRAGGWDAFNVTEDADLGIRLAYYGYRTRMLPSLTLEEAPIHLGGWLKQRTRWIKGYLQTWLVYMRHPAELKQRLGTRGYYGFQFFVGAPALTFLLAPVFWAVFIVGSLGLMDTHLSDAMLGLCGVSFVGGMMSHWLFARDVIRLENWKNMGVAMAVYPFYWLLHSLAATRAVWQLVFRPHYWDKTSHGISKLFKA